VKFKASITTLPLPPGKSDHIVFDGSLPGFGIRLRQGGARSWIVQYRAGGKQHRETIADVRRLDLDGARRAAKRRLGAVALGHDPVEEAREARRRAALTMGSLLPRFLDRKRTSIRASSFLATERHLLKRWAPLHDEPVHKITRRDVAARLADIEADYGPESARAARTILGEFFAWCMGEGLVEANPVIGTNEPPRSASRDRVLDDDELASLWRACEGMGGDYGLIVRLLILTGCRRDEIADLRWNEIDGGVLTLPGERTKNHRPLVLTLPPLALSILENVPFCRLGRDHRVFGKGRGPFSAWSQAKCELDEHLPDMPAWRVHDIRRSVATGMAEIGIQPHVIEACLNHVSGHKAGVAGVYNRASYTPEVKTALLRWADHVRAIVEGDECKVVPLVRT
jgi:integrase